MLALRRAWIGRDLDARCTSHVALLSLALLPPLLLLFAGCGGDSAGEANAPAEDVEAAAQEPELEPEPEPSEPYLERRRDFQTKLVKTGPAPEEFQPQTPPQRVSEVIYATEPAPGLKAWIQRPSPRPAASNGEQAGDWATHLASASAGGTVVKSPALVFLHGGFALKAGDLAACQPFVDAGFVVMTPMLRGENGNPGNFEMFLGEVDDARAAVLWLAQQPFVDPRKIYVFGHDIGGGVAALLTLHDGVPARHTGSSGGLYSAADFAKWKEIVPFGSAEDEPREHNLRLLLGNLADMRLAHYAFVGEEDKELEAAVQQADAERSALPTPDPAAEDVIVADSEPAAPRPEPQLFIRRIPGDHTSSFPKALADYLQLAKTDIEQIDAVQIVDAEPDSAEERAIPDDVAMWTAGDLRKAAEQRHVNLEKAVRTLAAQLIVTPAGPAAFARFAGALEAVGEEAPSEIDPTSTETNVASVPVPYRILRAAIEGLADSENPAAWETLTHLAQGGVATPIDRRLVQQWVLTATFERYQGPGHPSHQLATALTVQLDPTSARETIGNLTASALDRLLGYPSDETIYGMGAAAAQKAEAAALFGLQGAGQQQDAFVEPVAEKPQAADNALRLWTQTLSPESAQKMATFFWQAPLAGVLTTGLQAMPDPGAAGEILALCGAFPRQEIRTAIYQTCDRNWTQGAETLISRGLFSSAFRDPGLLVVLKSLPRVMPTGPLPQTGQNAPKSAIETRAKAAWMYASAQMALSLCERFSRSAASTASLSSPHFEGFGAPKLHRDARVARSVTLSWPEDLQGTPLAELAAPLKLQYLHIEAEGNPAETFRHYKNQLSRGADHTAGMMRWIDQFQAGGSPGTRRSVDVIFRPKQPLSGPEAAPANGGGHDAAAYRIDILIIEIPDPRPPRT